jgi:hypothetical protein
MKIQMFIPILAAALFATGFTAKENSEIILTESFSRISLQGNMKVILVQSKKNNTSLLYKNGKVSAEVNNGELVVKQKNSLFSNNEPFVIIPINQLRALKIKDNATVFTKAVIKTDELTIDQWGNGFIKLSIDASKVLVYSKGCGKIQIEGNYQQTLAQKDAAGGMIIEYRAIEK